MDVLTLARALVDSTWRLLWKGVLAFRAAGRRVAAAMRALPKTASEQVHIWRGQALAMPVAEQRQLLAEFYEKFEALVELICDAGFANDATPFQARYAEVRAWFLRAYPLIKPYLTAHLVHDPSDAEFGLRTVGHATDAMEALFCAEQLHTVLELDGGYLIARIERARSGLYRYADYLRSIISL